MEGTILLMGKGGEYFVAKKNKKEDELIPSSEKVYAREVVPFGFDFKFGHNGIRMGLLGYLTGLCVDKNTRKFPNKEEFPKINLNKTIEGLEQKAKEIEADYILIDNLNYLDLGTSWDITGRAQTLVKR